MPLHENIEVKSDSGIHNRCWRAKGLIKKGENVWWAGAPKQFEFQISVTEVESWPKEKRDNFMALAYQIDDNTLCGVDLTRTDFPPGFLEEYFVNHSCDGNSWYCTDDYLVATKDIHPGEEINYDYALTEAHEAFVIEKCLCGTALCRGRITGNDWKLPELQARYGDHFESHILKKIAAGKQ